MKIGKLFAEGRVSEIEREIQQRLEKEPQETDLWLELADLHKSQGDYPGAVAAYQNYLSRKDDWKVQTRLGLALEQMGQFANARENLLALDRLHPDDPDVLWGMARLCLYQSEWKSIRTQATAQEALKEAQKYLMALTSRKPGFALALWQLAEVSRKLGDRDQALRAYEQVVKQDGSYKLAHRHIAQLLAQKGRLRESLAKYEQAMAVEPDDAQLKEEAGRAAQRAPKEAARREKDRMRQWEEWTPPEEKPIAASATTIRVGVFTGMGHLLFRGDGGLQVMTPITRNGPATVGGNPLTVLAAKTDYQVTYVPAKETKNHQEVWLLQDMEDNTLVSFTQRLWITPLDPHKTISLHGVASNPGYFFAKEEDRAYRDVIEINPRSQAGFQVINRVSLDAYTAGVLPSEMPSSWPMEALKAQAIVVRTYVLSRSGRHNAEGFDVCDSVHCQVYRGLRAETERTNQAVNETAGMVLKHNGHILPVAFSAQCGGHTQDYADAWGDQNAVVGVPDYEPRFNQDMEFPLSPLRMENWIREDRVAYCRVYGLRGYQNYRWAWVVSAAQVARKAGTVGKVKRLVVTHRSKAGWANRLIVEGTAGTKEIKGDLIRSFLGGIRSNLIWIEPQFNLQGWPEEFIVYGGGWGHGVGMCQVGTYGLAKAGKNYEEIIRHYFPNGDLTKQ